MKECPECGKKEYRITTAVNLAIVNGKWQDVCDDCYKKIDNQKRSLKVTK